MGDTFICLADEVGHPEGSESCQWWDNYNEGMCPEAEYQSAAPSGAAFQNGHAEWRTPPTLYSSDATGVRDNHGPGIAYVRLSHSLGLGGTPDGYRDPDGTTWYNLSPYVQAIQTGPDTAEFFDYWDADPTGIPPGGEGSPEHPGDVGPRCGWFSEWSGHFVRVWQWCARHDQQYPREPLEVQVYRPHASRRMTFAQPDPCIVTGPLHHCFGMHQPGSGTGGFFVGLLPSGSNSNLLAIWNYLDVDLSGASFGPTRYPTIKYIKDAALQKVADLEWPNMDRLDVYQGPTVHTMNNRQGYYSRGWPVYGKPATPPPEHADDWPLLMYLPARLQGSRREGGQAASVALELILKRVDIRAWVQFVGIMPNPDAGDGSTRAAIVVDVEIDLDVRLRLDNWPKLQVPGYIKKSWLDPEDPNYSTEIETTWVQDGVSGCSIDPGVRTADGMARWNVPGERMYALDVYGDDPTGEPLPYIPTRFRWQGELGPLTDPPWPNLDSYITHLGGVGYCCDLARGLRPVSIPARKTRVQGTDAPDVYRGSVSLGFAPTGFEAICGG